MQPSPYSERSGWHTAEMGLGGLPESRNGVTVSAMPHYKDGTEAKVFDRVKVVTGHSYAQDEAPKPIVSEALVVGITPGAECCELTLVVGSCKLLGNVNLPQFAGDTHPPRAGVVLDGYWTSGNAKDCERVG